MKIQRNDIHVAVTPDGTMLIAQGNPALERLPDDAKIECCLYYSQLWHRCAWRDAEGVHIGTPTEALATGAKRVERFHRQHLGACGTPAVVGKV